MRQKETTVSAGTVPEIVAINTGMTAEQLLNDTAEYHINGLDSAAKSLRNAIAQGKTIYVPGDYDVDGISASVIMKMLIEELGGRCVVRLPRRFTEGYGMSVRMIDEFEPGQFIITVDNGITSFDAIKAAKEKGMYVIVTDHHLPAMSEDGTETLLPDADEIIDPNAIPGSADFNGYCGSGIAYKLALEMLGKDNPVIPKMLSLTAIATIADAVPLLYENRRIVRTGLEGLLKPENTTTGLRELLYQMDIEGYVDTDTIGFKIAPALNASGRLQDDGADLAFELLFYDGNDTDAATILAGRQVAMNQQRKIESASAESAIEDIIEENNMQDDFPLIVYAPGIPEGIVGIAAGQLSEKYRTPCILFTDNEHEGVIKGSGRAGGYCHLKKLLDKNRQYLLTYGGHAQAVGLSMERKNLEAFRESAKECLTEEKRARDEADTEVCYDLLVHEKDVSDTMEEIMKYAPYGEGNPALIICVDDMKLLPQYNRHYKLISNGRGVRFVSAEMEAVSFKGAEKYEKMGCPKQVKFCGHLNKNYFRGAFKNQLEILDMEPGTKTETQKSSLAKMLERRAMTREGGRTSHG